MKKILLFILTLTMHTNTFCYSFQELVKLKKKNLALIKEGKKTEEDALLEQTEMLNKIFKRCKKYYPKIEKRVNSQLYPLTISPTPTPSLPQEIREFFDPEVQELTRKHAQSYGQITYQPIKQLIYEKFGFYDAAKFSPTMTIGEFCEECEIIQTLFAHTFADLAANSTAQ